MTRLMPSVKFFLDQNFHPKFKPISISPNIYYKIQDFMETQNNTSDKLTIIIPLKDTCGESMETAIEISGAHINYVIPIQNKIIDYLMNEIPWTKTEQSLIFAENDRKYDKIGAVDLMDDGSTRNYEFWVDITECFGI
jgi:hypothetical protein